MAKYSNKKTLIDGHKFDSKKEANRYSELKMLECAGEIDDLKLQPKFLLQEKFVDSEGKKQRKIEYIADFMYKDKSGYVIVEDVKGMETEAFKIKKMLFLYRYPDIIFKLIK